MSESVELNLTQTLNPNPDPKPNLDEADVVVCRARYGEVGDGGDDDQACLGLGYV